MRTLTPIVALAAAAALAGCQSSSPRVAQADLESSIKTKLAEQVGQTPDAIDCPGDLTGEKGATMRCTLKAGADSVGLTVTVTSVEGTSVKYDIKVDDTVSKG